MILFRVGAVEWVKQKDGWRMVRVVCLFHRKLYILCPQIDYVEKITFLRMDKRKKEKNEKKQITFSISIINLNPPSGLEAAPTPSLIRSSTVNSITEGKKLFQLFCHVCVHSLSISMKMSTNIVARICRQPSRGISYLCLHKSIDKIHDFAVWIKWFVWKCVWGLFWKFGFSEKTTIEIWKKIIFYENNLSKFSKPI